MKILIAEDELKTASYLQKGLEEEGYSVDHASDGHEALLLASERSYDLLILDVMLPGRDGWDIITQLRKEGRKTLALFLTARDTVEDRIKGLDLGADAYLVKPFSFSELLALVRSLFRRGSQTSTASTFVIGDLAIDPVKHSAIRAGVKLELTPKEFALLLLLARRKGQILSRTTISEQVWDLHFDPGSNSVDVHIRRLRAKVDDPHSKKLIKTIRGVGYMMEDTENT